MEAKCSIGKYSRLFGLIWIGIGWCEFLHCYNVFTPQNHTVLPALNRNAQVVNIVGSE